MSSDLKIEIFAYQYFYRKLFRGGIVDTEQNILKIYEDECKEDNSYQEVCDILFRTAADCRVRLFSKIYFDELDVKKTQSWKSLSDCYDHLTCICDRDDLFGHLSIFERMLATISFVMYVCFIDAHFCTFPINVASHGHIIWAMYFDKFTETFYEEGGWRELKRVAKSYDFLNEVYCFLQFSTNPTFYLCISKEMSVNYSLFKNAVKNKTCKSKHEGKSNISKLWIEFRIKNFEKYERITLSYQESANWLEAESLLQSLKLLCDPTFEYDTDNFDTLGEMFQERICSTRIEYTKTFDKFTEIKTNKNLLFENIAIREPFCDKISKKRQDLKSQFNDEHSKSSEKIKTNIANMKNNFEKGKNLTCAVGISGIETEKRYNNLCDETLSQEKKNCKEYFTKSSDLEFNHCLTSFVGHDKNSLEDTSRRYNLEHQIEVRNATDGVPKNWKECLNLYNSLDFCFETQLLKSHIGNKISETGIESTFNTKTKGYDEDREINYALSTNEIAITCSGRNTILKNLHLSKDIVEVNEIKKNHNGRIKSNKRRNILREEMKDPEIKNFLRMILVLDDRQWIQSSYGALSCSQESQENLLVGEVKKKKRSKKSRK